MMENQLTQQATRSQPKDKTLAAYQDWIMEIAARLTTEKNTIQLTDAEWQLNWRDYWNGRSLNGRVREQRAG